MLSSFICCVQIIQCRTPGPWELAKPLDGEPGSLDNCMEQSPLHLQPQLIPTEKECKINLCVLLKHWNFGVVNLPSLIIPCLGSDKDKGKKLKHKSSKPSPQPSASCLVNLWFLIEEKRNEEIWVLTLLESVCVESGSAVWVWETGTLRREPLGGRMWETKNETRDKCFLIQLYVKHTNPHTQMWSGTFSTMVQLCAG